MNNPMSANSAMPIRCAGGPGCSSSISSSVSVSAAFTNASLRRSRRGRSGAELALDACFQFAVVVPLLSKVMHVHDQGRSRTYLERLTERMRGRHNIGKLVTVQAGLESIDVGADFRGVFFEIAIW